MGDWTERRILDMLRERHGTRGQSHPWAYMEHVHRTSAAGWPMAILDAMAIGRHRSRGNPLHGFEVKVSRSDFRAEVANPIKSGVWTGILDFFWIVAPVGVVPVGELLDGWGLIEASDGGLRIKRQAKRLVAAETFPRDVVADLVSGGQRAGQRTPPKGGSDV